MKVYPTNSETFLDKDDEVPMPIRLWEAGYDVWLGNNRGTTHSLHHIQHHPEKEP